jgi:hypothetical protein
MSLLLLQAWYYVLAELAGGILAALCAWPLYGTGSDYGIWHGVAQEVPLLASTCLPHPAIAPVLCSSRACKQPCMPAVPVLCPSMNSMRLSSLTKKSSQGYL